MTFHSSPLYRVSGFRRRQVAVASVAAVFACSPLLGQTGYYNTDHGRPFAVQDAVPLERFGLDIQLSPLRANRHAGSNAVYSAEPSIGWGVLPRTQIELGFPIGLGGSGAAATLSAVSVSFIHALNLETREIPALAISAGVTVPTGPGGRRPVTTEVGALATRSLANAFRVHLNASFLLAGADRSATSDDERWMAGAALDKTFPISGLLIGAELFVRAPAAKSTPSEWTTSVGARRQLAQRWVVDAGLGRTFTGARQATFASLGLGFAYSWIGPFVTGRR